MKLVIENVKSEHYKWIAEMAKALDFKVVEVELSDDEEDEYLLAAMEEMKDEPIVTAEEKAEFEVWLKAVK
ncbi:MAG: hypothetical protein EOP42_25255 [Sphingobacteriaceae bacterium]|nr:MAG: hypothetical protein EOP42_25255 [Sphingobacteriaceae bacterium]